MTYLQRLLRPMMGAFDSGWWRGGPAGSAGPFWIYRGHSLTLGSGKMERGLL